MIQKHEGSAQSTPEYPRNRAPESAYAATHPAPHHSRKHTPPTCASQLARGSIPPLHAPSATASPRKRTPRHTQRREKHTRRVPVKKQHRRLTPACTRLDTSATRAKRQRIAAKAHTPRHSSIRCPCYTRAALSAPPRVETDALQKRPPSILFLRGRYVYIIAHFACKCET